MIKKINTEPINSYRKERAKASKKTGTRVKTKARVRRKMHSNRIKSIMAEIGMSQQELADTMGVDSSHLSRIINGKRQCISLPIALEVAKALKRPVEEIFQLTKESKGK